MKLEPAIVEVLKNKKAKSTFPHMISHELKKFGFCYGSKGKQIVGMAIGRMRAKGVEANYAALK